MRIDKWSVTAQEALQAAMGIASDADAGQLEPLHLLKALLSGGERNLTAIIERVGADPRAIESQADALIAGKPKVTGSESSTKCAHNACNCRTCDIPAQFQFKTA